MIELQHLTKRFATGGGGDAAVLKDISLRVGEGEAYVLLGPSGCGKTTTLRMIAGLERPSSGEIRLAGRLVFSDRTACWVPPEARPVGMVFQSYALWPNMTAGQNVAFPLRHGRERLGREAARKRALEALELVQIPHLADRPVTALSGGQQQRVAVARAVAQRPRVLLLDEPLSNLDPALRADVRRELRALAARLGITSVIVTHDRDDAMALADRVAVMHDGVIEQEGEPLAIHRDPRSRFVASLMDEVNFLHGTVVGKEAARCIVAIGERRVAVSDRASLVPGGRAILGVRPRQVMLGTASEGLSGAVLRCVPNGHEYRCEIRVGEAVIVAYGHDPSLAADDLVGLEIRPEDWLVFPET